MGVYAWRVNEVLALLDLERGFRCVYVEGPSDKSLLDWFFDARGLSSIATYSITDVDVPPTLLDTHAQENSNRGRVMALAHEVAQRIRMPRTGLAFVIDRDFFLLEGPQQCCGGCALVLMTDGTSMEMYAYSLAWVKKYFALVLNRQIPDFDVLTFMEPVLTELYLIRFANRSLALGLTAVDFSKDCEIRNGQLEFDRRRYLERYLHRNGSYGRLAEIEGRVNESRASLGADARQRIHQEDFSRLFALLVSVLLNSRRYLGPAEAPERYLIPCLESAELATEPMFEGLVAALA